MKNNRLISYSRAGDDFHYKWAARRCLRLLYPDTELTKIVIEGSDESKKGGEYVIDLSEYFKTADDDNSIHYYQLKHTSVRSHKPMHLADLKTTLKGFADRFRQHEKEKNIPPVSITFNIVTNRKVADRVKDQLLYLAMGEAGETLFRRTFETYTKLKGKQLAEFCALIVIEDGEGNYKVQDRQLREELSQLVAGSLDSGRVSSLRTMVQDKVVSEDDHVITCEEVLKRFDYTNTRELFPAPPLWELDDAVIVRARYDGMIRSIDQSEHPVIIHAAGGVGKSFFCRYLLTAVPEYSLTIAYDCFGTGSYRNRSSFRHRYHDGLVQIVNELATKGLCEPLLVLDTTRDDAILRKFLERIKTSVRNLKKANNKAQLYIAIDAADNAEMAAEEFKDNCFAKELLRERMPEGCKLVMLCRTERRHLLKPADDILQLELTAFSEPESLQHLWTRFPYASVDDGTEFYRLTGGNPRVQANALATDYATVTGLLGSFGPDIMTVEMQIEEQLRKAVSKIRDAQTPNFQESITAICTGLASLPPHIPVSILAGVAGVSQEAILSFIADLGRPLWVSDASVQFRDEPTETWFRQTFLADKADFALYISRLEPLALSSAYVSQVLPQLYLQAGEYDKLIRIALSDDLLPAGNPIDSRNVRVFRLRFAFIAALKSNKLRDAAKLALKAGEEVAGNSRQFFLLKNNLDLLAGLQGKEKVQEIAFKSKLRSGWEGSENVYTASLLSTIPDYKGEARRYLRSARNWLNIYFREKKKQKDNHEYRDQLNEKDLMEVAYAHLNIDGVTGSVEFLNHIRPKEYVANVIALLAERLVDEGKMETLQKYAESWQNEPYYVVAIANALMQVGQFITKSVARKCLDQFGHPKKRINRKRDYFYDDRSIEYITGFIETCFHYRLNTKKIRALLDHYIPQKANRMVVSDHSSKDRTIFLRALSMRLMLEGKTTIHIEDLLPAEVFDGKKSYEQENELKKYKESIGGLLPWFLLHAQVLRGEADDFFNLYEAARKTSTDARKNRYGSYDQLPKDIADLVCSVLVLGNQAVVQDCYRYLKTSGNSFHLGLRFRLLRAAYRTVHLQDIRDELEQTTYKLTEESQGEGPEEMAESYISLARAVAQHSPPDAGVYFNRAVEIISKFGDELVRRWEAVEALAERATATQGISDEFAYRFIRCIELTGNYVSREKHWSRSSAVRVSSRMSPSAAIAATSRWRERVVGRYQYQLEVLTEDLVKRGLLQPQTAWAFSHFFTGGLGGFASVCIRHEMTTTGKQAILDSMVHRMQTEGTNKKYIAELQRTASASGLAQDGLAIMAAFHAADNEDDERAVSERNANDKLDRDLDPLFKNIRIDSPEGFSELLTRFRKKPKERFAENLRTLLIQALLRITHGQFNDFLDVVLVSEQANMYDVKAMLAAVPEEWKTKPAFKAAWPSLIRKYGQHYATDLVNKYNFEFHVTDLQLNEALIKELKMGVIEGLQCEQGLHDEETFFGFCYLSAPLLSPSEALELTDYGMQRFEPHMGEELGDGPYGPAVAVKDDLTQSIAKFTWSVLGSPWGWERWNAAHAVRSLGEFGCADIIDTLFGLLAKGNAGAYGSDRYVFYRLHAVQYFFIAIARLSLTSPGVLVKHAGKISEYALGTEHLLIQKFATDAALNIEKAVAGTYNEDIIDQLAAVGKTQFAVQRVDYNYRTESIWHVSGKIDTSIEFHFGWDFDRYWFEPLGDVFGVSTKQVQDIAADIVVNEWGLGGKDGYRNDERSELWKRASDERETWHDHGDYPKTDNLDFYLSYHAMMVAGAKLLKKMPVVQHSEWNEDPLAAWLSRHLLTLDDGRWLYDIRGRLPLVRPDWISQEKTDEWQDDIKQDDFRQALIEILNEETWVTVGGGWYEKFNERKEDVSVRSAFVATTTSDALLRALQTCKDHRDYKLPHYEEEEMEMSQGPFVLKGWLQYPNKSRGLDDLDYRSANVDYPLITPGPSILSDLNLIAAFDIWTENGKSDIVMKCENWSTDRSERDEYTDQCGMRLKATLGFLMRACQQYGQDLIIEIRMDRDLIFNKMGGNNRYGNPIVQLLILSADGTFRTTEGNFKIR